MYSTVQCSRCSHSIVCAIQVFTVPYLYCALYCTISNKITVMTFLIYFSWSRKENHFLSVYFIMSIFALENKILKFKSVVLSCARIQSDLKLIHASRAGQWARVIYSASPSPLSFHRKGSPSRGISGMNEGGAINKTHPDDVVMQ